jgi:hypothetical protein
VVQRRQTDRAKSDVHNLNQADATSNTLLMQQLADLLRDRSMFRLPRPALPALPAM